MEFTIGNIVLALLVIIGGVGAAGYYFLFIRPKQLEKIKSEDKDDAALPPVMPE